MAWEGQANPKLGGTGQRFCVTAWPWVSYRAPPRPRRRLKVLRRALLTLGPAAAEADGSRRANYNVPMQMYAIAYACGKLASY